MLVDTIQLLEGAKITNVAVDSGATFPSNPDAGELFFKTTDSSLYVYDGSQWAQVGAGAGGAGATGPTGPTGPTGATGAAGPTGSTGPTGPSGSSISIPGSNTQLIYNNGGTLGATTGITFTASGTLQLTTIAGAPSTTFTIRAAAATAIGTDASDMVIQAGASANSVASQGGRSGYLMLAGGDGDAGSGSGGDLILRGGTGPVSSGTVYIRTGSAQTDRLQITAIGAWGLGGANYGTSGQVLTSNGSSSAPTWQTVASGPTGPTGDTGATGAAGAAGPTGPTGPAGSGASFDGGTVANATTFSSGVTLSSSLTFGTAYTETSAAVTAAASTTINCATSNNFAVDMAASITSLSFSNVPAAGRVYNMTLVLKQDATGSRTITWPAAVKWASGTAPTLTTTAGKFDILTLMTNDGGTTWFGFVAGQNY
jgi:hypothetical protein